MTDWALPETLAKLHDSALIWDSHSGFEPEPDVDLNQLARWRDSGVDYLSINISYDRRPWEGAYLALSAYRTWIMANPGGYALCGTLDDVRKAKAAGKLACSFDIEGMTALNQDVAMVEVFHRLGVRQMLIAYNLNNPAGGGCHDEDCGLTDFGRAVIAEMNRVGMTLDCSHTGIRTSLEAMEASRAPVIFSHSNARSLCDHERNISDQQIIAVAATGGMVGVTGIGIFLGDGGPTVENLIKHIDYMSDLIGAQNVGISLDYSFTQDMLNNDNGEAFWPSRQYADKSNIGFIEPEAYPKITQALVARGYDDNAVKGFLGENFMRVASTVWAAG